MSVNQSVKDYAKKERAAWRFFESQYRRQHQPPDKPGLFQWLPLYASFYIILIVASAALGAMRTAPVFATVGERFAASSDLLSGYGWSYALLEGLLSMIVVDTAAIAFRLTHILNKKRTEELSVERKRWTQRGFVIALLTQLTANMYASMFMITVLPEQAIVIAEFVIAIMSALAAVFVAIASADVLSTIVLSTNEKRTALNAQYAEQLSAYEKAMNKEWGRAKARYGLSGTSTKKAKKRTTTRGQVQVEVEQPVQSSVQKVRSARGSTSDAVRRWMAANEQIVQSLSLDKLIEAMRNDGVSAGRTTVNNVRREMLAG